MSENFYLASGFKERVTEIVMERSVHNVSESDVDLDMDYLEGEGFIVSVGYYYSMAPDLRRFEAMLYQVNMSEFSAWLGE